MEWSDVRIFLAVVRAGTLGGAARALQLSHPTIGRRLRALEQAVGHTLFQRTANGFVPTDEGAGIVALAEQMEEGALAMERRLAGREEKLQGSLRISSAAGSVLTSCRQSSRTTPSSIRMSMSRC